MRQKYGHAEASGELAHAGHPWVGLRQNPVCADGFSERVATYTTFRSDDPGYAGACGDRDRFLDKPPVLCEITRDGGEMKEGNSHSIQQDELLAGIGMNTTVFGT